MQGYVGKIVVVTDLVSGMHLHSIYGSDLMCHVLLNSLPPWTIPLELVLISRQVQNDLTSTL